MEMGLLSTRNGRGNSQVLENVRSGLCLALSTNQEEEQKFEVKETNNREMRMIVEKVPRQYVVKKMSENMMKMTVKEKKKRKIITIINVYAPTTSRAREFPQELITNWNYCARNSNGQQPQRS